LKKPFREFLEELPNCETRDKPGSEDGEWEFKFSARDAKGAQTLELFVKNREELWRVFLFAKAPARVEIPEIEFEIQGASKIVVDSIYNHL